MADFEGLFAHVAQVLFMLDWDDATSVSAFLGMLLGGMKPATDARENRTPSFRPPGLPRSPGSGTGSVKRTANSCTQLYRSRDVQRPSWQGSPESIGEIDPEDLEHLNALDMAAWSPGINVRGR